MSDERDPDQDLERFGERLDRAFAATRAPEGFERALRARLARRPRWWEHAGVRALGAAAAVLVVVGAVGLLLGRPAGTSMGSSAARPPAASLPVGGAAQGAERATASFGPLPRPAVASASPAIAQTPAAGGGRQGVTIAVPLPTAAPVLRYAEPSAADAASFAAAHGGGGVTVRTAASDPARGVSASFVMTVDGVAAGGGGPDAAGAQAAAAAFLAQHGLVAPSPARVDMTVAPGVPTTVRWVPQVAGVDVVLADGSPAGLVVTVGAGGAVLAAEGPLPVTYDRATYALAALAELVQEAGPGVDHAELVYVVAADGRYGYLEPAVLFTGPGRRVLVPAVASAELR